MNPITSFVKRYPLAIFFAIAYITSFVGGYLAEVYPSDIWAIFVYGPIIGAFVVTAIAEGRGGLRVCSAESSAGGLAFNGTSWPSSYRLSSSSSRLG